MNKSELEKSEATAGDDVDEFSKLITKFLYLNFDHKSNGISNQDVEELNSILNELNCLALKNVKWHMDKSILNLLGSLKYIPISNDTLIVKACFLICSIINKWPSSSLAASTTKTTPPTTATTSTTANTPTTTIPLVIIRETINWLIQCLSYNFDIIICNVLAALQCLIKGNVMHLDEFYDYLMATDGLFVRVIKDFQPMNKPTRYDSNRPEEIQLYAILCIETVLHGLCQQKQEAIDVPDDNNSKNLMEKFPLRYLTTIGNCLLKTIYCKQMNNLAEHSFCTFITAALNSCKYIAIVYDKWSGENIGEILGAAEAYISYGLSVDGGSSQYNTTVIQPKKVHISQQALIEPQYVNLNKGGKIMKIRKLKEFTKKSDANKKSYKKKNDKINTTHNNNDNYSKPEHSYFDRQFQIEFDPNNLLSTTFLTTTKASDSDFSDAADSTNRAQKDRQKISKVRLAAISVIGILAKNIEKKLFVGYWHSIFPQDQQQIKYSILNTITSDPNIKCRSAALQTMAIALHGSRPFLIQAECSEKASASFIPFSITLGNMTVIVYEKLTEALIDESSLQVLINVLKCFVVLLQVTALHKLQNGLVTKFIGHIKRCANHSDTSVQIVAIKVIGALLSTQEITPEISQCIGIPTSINYNSRKKTPNDLHNFGINEIIDSEYGGGDDDGYGDGDGDDNADDEIDPYDTNLENVNEQKIQDNTNQTTVNKIDPWLLMLVLDNIKDSKLTKSRHAKIVLKMECFLMLSAMGKHFILVKDHLPDIAIELMQSINENELQLCTVKCLDIIGYSINQYLLNDDPSHKTTGYINICLSYWLTILPILISQLQEETFQKKIIVKITCIDALSNIGVHVYERLPHKKQILLVSVLTGSAFDDLHLIRAAAVRALAIYAKYPTLCGDRIFIENTIEATCRLLEDRILAARVKASWALGSISDVFLTNSLVTKSSTSPSSSTSSSSQVISNDLLKRLFEISIKLTTDNYKIRCNAVRVIGNLLRLITMELLALPLWMDLCYRSIASLVQNSTVVNNMKVKWNACYAIGNFMGNNVMFENSNCNWKQITFPALCETIVKCSIFKVRINATCALAIPVKRQYYNPYFFEIWRSLLMAIEQADKLDNVNEYKHRDHLMEQLCITIAHFINLCELKDLCEMNTELQQYDYVVKQVWERVINRIVSAKVHCLMSACKKLNDIQQTTTTTTTTTLTANQKLSINMLKSCFVEIKEYNL